MPYSHWLDSDMDKKVDELVKTFTQALVDENAAIFAGAGLSVPSGFVNWRELMRSVAAELGLNVDREYDLIALAQYHCNERGGRHRINQLLIQEFTKDAQITENHTILANLPIRVFWTTNYDNLIERSLNEAGKTADVKITAANLAINKPRSDAIVYKMHGDISQPESAVITKDDYEAYNEKRQLFSTGLQGDLVSKTFLFLGLSFNDPNLDYLLSRIRVLLGENRREHYSLMRKVQRSDFSTKEEYTYANTKQELQVRDLKRYGIIGVLVDDYSDYTEILRKIDKRYRRTSIFVSGSAETYEPWSGVEAHSSIEKMSAKFIQRGYRVVSGFGYGIGSSVINGALTQLRSINSARIDDRLILKPFPRYSASPETLRENWGNYRKNIVALAGIAIFIFGNKKADNGEIIDADGVFEEFKIAVERGLVVVPIGATGYISAKLHQEVLNDFEKYYGKRSGLKRKFRDSTPLKQSRKG